MKPIVKIPDPVLTGEAKEVVRFDKKLAHIIREMKTTLRGATNPKGVGLAAPQVGIPLRIFLTRQTEKSPIRVFINPVIINQEPLQETSDKHQLEGCLSIPGIWGIVRRSPSLTLRYQDEQGLPHEEVITGFLATIVQHEVDHIHGTLFTKRVIEQHGKLYQTGTDEKGKEVLEEVVI